MLRLAVLVPLLLIGCAKTPPAPREVTPGLREPTTRPDLKAVVTPPETWTETPVESGSNFTQQVWVSPTEATAYGVIRFSLPFPVGHDLSLKGFLDNLRKSEGKAELISKTWDEANDRLNFVATGGRYTVHTTMTVRGFRGWAVFAGTKTDTPVNDAEFRLAEQARDATVVNP